MTELQTHFKHAVVGLSRLESYKEPKAVTEALRQALEPLGGMKAFVKPGDKVLLKVNLVAPAKASEAATTHPEFVRGVIRLVKSAGGVPRVGDGPGVGDTLTGLRASGMLKVLEEEGVEPAIFDETSTYENKSNLVMPSLDLTSQLDWCDVLITLPKLKTHVQMGYTGAVKNQYGLIPGAMKARLHFRFQNRDRLADLMVDINRTAKTRLALMDGVIAMEGNGPTGGNPRQLGAVLASDDLPALDVVACSLIGISPEENPLNLAARRANWGTTYLEDIEVSGEDLDEIRCHDFVLVKKPANMLKILPLPNFVLRFLRRQFAPRPVIDIEKCRKCGRCSNGCPVKPAAINPFAETAAERLNDKTCIRCYCCHEFCPAKAIDLRKTLLAKLLPMTEISDSLARIVGRIRAFFK